MLQRVRDISTIMHYADSGEMPPIGEVDEAGALIAFSFGVRLDETGHVMDPGTTNRALATLIVNNDALRASTTPWYLQDEIADCAFNLDPSIVEERKIYPMASLKSQGQTYNSYELIQQATPQLRHDNAETVAVVAFRHHLPRAVGHVLRAGFKVVTPDMRQVGEFDPDSSQPWTRNREAWIKRERKVIGYCAIRGYI